MKKISDLRTFHEQLNSAFYELEKEEEFPNHFYQSLLSGNNEIYQKSVEEKKIFHEDWIQTVESYFNSLDKITRDPKSGLKYLQEVEAIEKAKKINSDSIRHLAANTQLIKEVRGTDVIPKRILTTQAEIEYAIYENRFIKTLVDRLFDFVNRRYDIVKHNVENYSNRYFNMKSEFEMRGSFIDLTIDMKMKDPLLDDAQAKANTELLNRIQNLLKLVNGIRVSPFMEGLKNAKPVQAPIMQTSILLKNIDYKNCYHLWLYLDRYNLLNFDVEVKEKNLSFDRYYLRNVYQTALTTFTTVYGNQKALEDHYEFLDEKVYTRKSPKFVKKSLEELLTAPDPFVLEDTTINQYFLEQNKKAFKEKLDRFQEESSSYDVALRKALRDTIQISNALFEDFFGLNEDEEDYDIFRRMVKEDLDSELLEAKERARVARIIRETKEVDYNNSIRLEKRMLKEIDRIDKEIQKKLKRKHLEEAKKQAVEERIRLERKNLDKNQKALSSYLEFVAEQKRLLQEQNKVLLDRIKEEERSIKAEEKKIIEAEKKKARDKYQKELKRMKTKLEKDQLKVEKDTKKKLNQFDKKFLDAQKKLKQKSRAKVKEKTKEINQKVEEKLKETA